MKNIRILLALSLLFTSMSYGSQDLSEDEIKIAITQAVEIMQASKIVTGKMKVDSSYNQSQQMVDDLNGLSLKIGKETFLEYMKTIAETQELGDGIDSATLMNEFLKAKVTANQKAQGTFQDIRFDDNLLKQVASLSESSSLDEIEHVLNAIVKIICAKEAANKFYKGSIEKAKDCLFAMPIIDLKLAQENKNSFWKDIHSNIMNFVTFHNWF